MSMRTGYTGSRQPAEWPVRRGMLLGGALALAATAVVLCLPLGYAVVLACICSVGAIAFLICPFSCRATPLFCCLWTLAFLVSGICRQVWEFRPLMAAVGQQDTVTARVVELPRTGQLYTVEVTQGDKLPVGTMLKLYCPDTAAPDLHDEIVSKVALHASTQLYYRAQGVLLLAFPTEYGEEALTVTAKGGTLPWQEWLTPVRLHMAERLQQYLPGDEGALLAAICVGERSGLSAAVQEDFRVTGLSHLLAVSGLHVSILAGCLTVLLQKLRLSPRTSAVITMTVIGLFTWLVGMTPSVTRACVMCMVLLSGRLFRYQVDSLNSLGFALVILLAADANTVYDMGFWLSFMATAGILCLTPAIQQALLRQSANNPPEGPVRRLLWRCRRFIVLNLAVTLGATVPLLPLLAWQFGEISLLTPLYNLLAVTASGYLLIFGCCGTVAAALLPLCGVGYLLCFPAGILAKLLLWLVSLPPPEAATGIRSVWALIWLTALCGLIAACIGCRAWRLLWKGMTLLTVLFFLIWSAQTVRLGKTADIYMLPGDGVTLYIEQKDHTALLVQDGSDLKSAWYWLQERHVRQVDTVVLCSAATSQAATLLRVGGLSGRYLAYGDDEWATALDVCVEHPRKEEAAELWAGCTVLGVADGWLLTLQGALLHISFGESGNTAASLSVSAEDGALRLQYGDDKTKILPKDTPCVLVTAGSGEWSVMRWL